MENVTIVLKKRKLFTGGTRGASVGSGQTKVEKGLEWNIRDLLQKEWWVVPLRVWRENGRREGRAGQNLDVSFRAWFLRGGFPWTSETFIRNMRNW